MTRVRYTQKNIYIDDCALIIPIILRTSVAVAKTEGSDDAEAGHICLNNNL